MKNKKQIIGSLSIITVILLCIINIFLSGRTSLAKTITIDKGKTYQLDIKKGSKIKCSSKKIIRVTKKGKIKALKTGKCTVKILSKKKIKSYKIRVQKTEKLTDNNTAATDIPVSEQSQDKTQRPDYTVGNMLYCSGMAVDRIVSKNDESVFIYLTFTKRPIFISTQDCQNGVKYLKIERPNQYIIDKEIKEGDNVAIVYDYINLKPEIEGDTCNVGTGAVSIY